MSVIRTISDLGAEEVEGVAEEPGEETEVEADEVEADDGAAEVAGKTAAASERTTEESPGRQAAKLSLDTATNLAEMKAALRHYDETRIAFLAQAAYEVGVEKARERGDLDQKIEDAFRRSFATRDRLGVMPWVEEGILWAPGSKQDSSAHRHVCRFVKVKTPERDGWVWEHNGVIQDAIRRNQDGAKSSMTSITLIVLEPGAEVDVITQESRQGAHRVRKIDSFVYDGQDLEKVGSRHIPVGDHR